MAESATVVISPTLLELINEDKPVPHAFSLGMDDWLDGKAFLNEPEVTPCNNEPHPPNLDLIEHVHRPKRFKPSASVQEKLTDKGDSAWFQLFTEDELDSLSVCFISQNTTKSTKCTFEKYVAKHLHPSSKS